MFKMLRTVRLRQGLIVAINNVRIAPQIAPFRTGNERPEADV